MGLIASTSASSASALSLFTSPGVGVGGIFVTALLTYLLAYLNVVEASERSRQQLQSLLVVASVPLMLVFAAVIGFKSLTIVGLI